MEIWKDVVDFEGLYEVSNLGRIRTNENINYGHYKGGRILNPGLTSSGYLVIALWKDRTKVQKTVHSIVLEAFKGPRPFGYVARHLNGVQSQNFPENLEWGTYKQNSDDRKGHGTVNHGSRHGMSKMYEEDVLRIRAMSKNGISNVVIAKEFSLTPSNVGYVVKRKTWTHI